MCASIFYTTRRMRLRKQIDGRTPLQFGPLSYFLFTELTTALGMAFDNVRTQLYLIGLAYLGARFGARLGLLPPTLINFG